MNEGRTEIEDDTKHEENKEEMTVEILTAYMRRGGRGRIVDFPRWVQ